MRGSNTFATDSTTVTKRRTVYQEVSLRALCIASLLLRSAIAKPVAAHFSAATASRQ